MKRRTVILLMALLIGFFPLASAIAQAQATEQPPIVRKIGSGIRPPVVLKAPDPEFSDEARRQKISGTVLVYLQVAEDGTPDHLRVVRGLGYGLDEKALEAVQGYRFRPATLDGKPVRIEMNIAVNFAIFTRPS